MKKLIFFLILIFLKTVSYGQISYRSRYTNAVYLESAGLSPIVSANYEYSFFRKMKSFLAFRAGLGFVPGAKKASGLGVEYTAYSMPLSVTQNLLINNLRKRLTSRVTRSCNSMPPKFSSETFFEYGIGITPIYYTKALSKADSHKEIYWGIIGLRQQFVVDVPPKPKVFFVRLTYTPSYDSQKFVSLNPIGPAHNVFGASVGMSF